jgi:hypothetical protein
MLNTRFHHLGIMCSALLALSACSAPSRYMGINFATGIAPQALQQLAQRAQTGDKQAQLALGIAFEEGRGVAADMKKAQKLYRLASMNSGGTTWVYVPSTRKGQAGHVMPVNMGPRQSGLAEAKLRLAGLQD